MTKEVTEKFSSVEKMSKEKMAETIKAASRKENSSKKEQVPSICDIMKENTTEVIQKLESSIPTYTQLYSDLYTKYLHMIDDLYGSCYLAEKEFFDKFAIDKSTIGAFETYWKFITDITVNQIEQTKSFAKMYVQFRLSTLETFDQALHLMTENYARGWSWFNSNLKK